MKNHYSLFRSALLAVFFLLVSGGFSEVAASITGQPQSITFCIGSVDDPSPATFSCKSSYLIPQYQWQYYKSKSEGFVNFTEGIGGVSGSTTGTLSILRPKGGWPASTLTVRCAVKEGKTLVYSRSATLTPQKAPAFTTNPVSQTIWIGETATFTSSASGTPAPSYQWAYLLGKLWSDIPKATGSSFTTSSARTYSVTASNTCGTVRSGSASLSRVGITGQPESVTICEGEMNEVSFSVDASGATAYQWQRWEKDPFIKGGGSYVDIDGEISSTLVIPVPGGGYSPSNNGQFRCNVSFSLGTIASNSAVLTVNGLPVITSHPSDAEKDAGESVTFTVAASSTTTKTYQWKLDGGDIEGATMSSYSIDSVTPADEGAYTCVVANSCGSDESNGALLTVLVADWPDGWFPQAEGLTTKNYYDVFFVSANEGWALAYDNTNIFHTVNGGESWSPQSLGASGYLYAVYFSDADHGWASGNTQLSYTTNGGDNWTQISLYSLLGNKQMYTQDIHFVDDLHGWMVGSDGMIIYTDDGGGSWSIQNESAGVTDADLYGVHFTDADTGYACGAGGIIVKTTNGGANWAVQATPNNEILRDIDFISADTGWAVGWYDNTPGVNNSTILKTTDGGATWAQITGHPYSYYLYEVDFTDANNGVAVGYNGTILKTIDGGETWYKQESGTTEYLYAVHMIDSDNGWAVGPTGTMVRTATGGCLTPSVDLKEDQFLCANLSTMLVADTFANNVNVSYLWSPGGQATGSLLVDTSGTYSVDVTNLCGVTRSDEIIVTFYDLPEADAGEDVQVCEGDTVQLEASGGLIYSWKTSSKGSGYISDPASQNPLVAAGVGSTGFTVTVTDINDCSASDAVVLNTYRIPTSGIIAPAAFCRNEEVLINYGGNAHDTANYYWNFDSGDAIPSGLGEAWSVVWDTTGIQTIALAVNEAGCYSDTNWLQVIVNPIPVSEFILQDAVCGSDQVDIVYNGAVSPEAVFDWDFDGGTVISGSGSGPYAVSWEGPGNKTVSLSVDDKGCLSDTTDGSIIVSYPYDQQEICLVSVDLETGKNAIIWEKNDDPGIEFYNIYRESNTSNVYSLIATLPSDTLSYYVDQGSQPGLKSHKYKISVLDTCGNESDVSLYHKSMLLTTGLGSDRINVSWTEYEVESSGFGFVTYIIYRGPATNKLAPIDTIPADNTLYPDINPPAGVNYYQVAGVAADECNPSGKFKAGTGPYSHSLSNLDDNKLKDDNTGIDELAMKTALRVYPNPFRDRATVEYHLNQRSDVQVEVYNILGVRVMEVFAGQQMPGSYHFDIRSQDLDGSSVCYLKFSVNGSTAVKKLIPAR